MAASGCRGAIQRSDTRPGGDASPSRRTRTGSRSSSRQRPLPSPSAEQGLALDGDRALAPGRSSPGQPEAGDGQVAAARHGRRGTRTAIRLGVDRRHRRDAGSRTSAGRPGGRGRSAARRGDRPGSRPDRGRRRHDVGRPRVADMPCCACRRRVVVDVDDVRPPGCSGARPRSRSLGRQPGADVEEPADAHLATRYRATRRRNSRLCWAARGALGAKRNTSEATNSRSAAKLSFPPSMQSYTRAMFGLLMSISAVSACR